MQTDSHLSHYVNHVDIPGGITKAGYFSQSKLAQSEWGDGGVLGGGGGAWWGEDFSLVYGWNGLLYILLI